MFYYYFLNLTFFGERSGLDFVVVVVEEMQEVEVERRYLTDYVFVFALLTIEFRVCRY